MKKEIKEYIEKYIDLIDSGDFSSFYRQPESVSSYGEITDALMSVGIDPLADSDIVYPQMFKGSEQTGKFVVPEGIKHLGGNAFAKSSFSSIYLPNSLTTIGQRCFYRAKASEIVFPDDCDLKFIEEEAFYFVEEVKKIVIPKKCIHIGMMAFSHSGVEEVTLPSNLVNLGTGAFMHTPLKSIQLPEHLSFIGTSVFLDCRKLQRIYVPQSFVMSTKSLWKNIQGDLLEGNDAEIVIV